MGAILTGAQGEGYAFQLTNSKYVEVTPVQGEKFEGYLTSKGTDHYIFITKEKTFLMPSEWIREIRIVKKPGSKARGKDSKLPTLYFAYGSNMDPAQMKARGVQYSERKRATLDGYALRFNKTATGRRAKNGEGKGNIEPKPGDKVEGALYTVTSGLGSLDKHEGYPSHYEKKQFEVRLDDGTAKKALVYVAKNEMTAKNLKPTRQYLSHYLEGRDLLSTDYYQMLERVETLD